MKGHWQHDLKVIHSAKSVTAEAKQAWTEEGCCEQWLGCTIGAVVGLSGRRASCSWAGSPQGVRRARPKHSHLPGTSQRPPTQAVCQCVAFLAPFPSHACRYIKQMLSRSPAVSSEAFCELNKLDFHVVNPHSKSRDIRPRQLLSWVSLSKQVTPDGAAPALSKQFRPQQWQKCPCWVPPHNTPCHNPRSLYPQRGEAEVTALWGQASGFCFEFMWHLLHLVQIKIFTCSF